MSAMPKMYPDSVYSTAPLVEDSGKNQNTQTRCGYWGSRLRYSYLGSKGLAIEEIAKVDGSPW